MAAHSFAHDLLLCDVSCALWDCPWPVSRDGTCGEAEDAFAEVCHASWRLVRHFDLHVEQGISLLLGSLPAVHEGEQCSGHLLALLLSGPTAYGSHQGSGRGMDPGRLFHVHPWRGKLHHDWLHNSGHLSVGGLQQERDRRLPHEQNRHEAGSNDLHHVHGPGLAPVPLPGSGLDMEFCCRGGCEGKLALSPAQRDVGLCAQPDNGHNPQEVFGHGHHPGWHYEGHRHRRRLLAHLRRLRRQRTVRRIRHDSERLCMLVSD
mmetsp:Transcript_17297/g.37877  ORF Transcript_17297/g.37877 Transcript_17297/m.37877 type:complete len:261 (+) Transcript_17297:174-956(+)